MGADTMGKPIFYTIGHSNRRLEELINLLKEHGIKVVADVRRWPTSRRFPWFRKENLEKELSMQGIKYLWLGDLLGGYREGGYRKYMETREYKKGIERLVKLAEKNGRVAILCMEKLWFRCHRRFIADTLVAMGYRVIHIIDKDRKQEHRLL